MKFDGIRDGIENGDSDANYGQIGALLSGGIGYYDGQRPRETWRNQLGSFEEIRFEGNWN